MLQPSASNIFIELCSGDSRLFPGLEVEELLYDGESAEIENEAGMLEDHLSDLGFKPENPGKYFVQGFRAYYTKDYYGEVDVDCEFECWREATPEDESKFFEAKP